VKVGANHRKTAPCLGTRAPGASAAASHIGGGIRIARIEAATKTLGSAILISDDVRHAIEEVAPESFSFGTSKDLELKGKRGMHRVHEVIVDRADAGE